MRTRILTALLAAVAFSTTAFAQATLETLMTHSTSSAVSTHAGTALGNAINRAAGNVAHQTATTTGRVTPVPRTASVSGHKTTGKTPVTSVETFAPPYSAPISGNGSLIASIQGGEQRSSATSGNAKSCDATTTPAGATPNCAVAAPQAADHPSVVNLPAPQ
jgi:hypothetical protein